MRGVCVFLHASCRDQEISTTNREEMLKTQGRSSDSSAGRESQPARSVHEVTLQSRSEFQLVHNPENLTSTLHTRQTCQTCQSSQQFQGKRKASVPFLPPPSPPSPPPTDTLPSHLQRGIISSGNRDHVLEASSINGSDCNPPAHANIAETCGTSHANVTNDVGSSACATSSACMPSPKSDCSDAMRPLVKLLMLTQALTSELYRSS